MRHDDDGSLGFYEPRELRPIHEVTVKEPAPTVTKTEWEVVNASTSRLKVPGGWLYRTRTYKNLTRYENFPEKDEFAVTSESTTFVPNPTS